MELRETKDKLGTDIQYLGATCIKDPLHKTQCLSFEVRREKLLLRIPFKSDSNFGGEPDILTDFHGYTVHQ
jgi:hypothetical protein